MHSKATLHNPKKYRESIRYTTNGNKEINAANQNTRMLRHVTGIYSRMRAERREEVRRGIETNQVIHFKENMFVILHSTKIEAGLANI